MSSKLGDLLTAAGMKVNADAPARKDAGTAAATPPAAGDFGGAPKLVVRRERKGRGGKTATVVEGLRVAPSALERLSRELRRALGCGAHVEDGRIVVQGDLVERVVQWLAARGAPRVVVGN